MAAANLSSLTAVAESGHGDAQTGEKGEKHVASSCEMCVNKCGFYAHVVNGRIKKLNPNPHFFKSRSMLCARGNAGAEEPYNPERLKAPLVRDGERGENKWRKISYEEAFQIVAQKLAEAKAKYENRSSVAFFSSEGLQEGSFHMLAQTYGSTNTVRHPSLCLSSTIQGWSSVYGVYPDADLANAMFVVMPGANRAEAIVTPDSMDFLRYRPKGQQLVVLDPRFTNTAAKADKWYPVKTCH
ncbi:MAG: molybdopterin-dependent oxidoreductase [Geovibrio sp.]|nr:molybdopterin-dependent oxidoreductase [Geovibrio sp.]